MSKQESVESDISESLLSPRPSRRESVASVSQVQDSSSQDSLGSMCEMKTTVELHKDLRIGGSMERDLTVSSLETKPDPNFVVKVEAKCSGSSSSSSDSLSKVLTPPSAGGIKTELKFEEHHVNAQVNGLQSAKTVKEEVCTEDKSVCECSESENTNVKSNCAVDGSSSEPPCGSVDSMSAPPRTSDTSSVSTDSDRTCEWEVSQTCKSDRLTQEVGDTSCDVSTGAKRPLESGSESAACSSSAAAAASSWAVPSHSVILPDEGCSSDRVKPVAVDRDGEVSESVSRRNSQEVREEDDNMKVDSAGEIAHGRDLMEVVPSVSNVSSGRVDSSQSQEKSKESSDETAASSSDSSIPSAQPQHHIETDNADAVVDSGTNSVFERGKSSEKDSIEISSSNEVSGVRTLQQQQQGESSSSSSSSTAAVLESEQEVDSTAVATTSHSDSALLDAKVDSTCTEQMECTERTDSSSSSSAVSSSAKPLNILPQLDTTSCESAEAEAISPVTPPVVIVSTISSSPSSLAQVSSAISSSSGGGGGSGSSSSHSSCGASTNHNSDPVSSSSLNLMAAATMVPLLCTNTCVNTSAATVAAAATSAAAAATTTTTPPTPPIKKKVSLRHDSLFLLLEGGKENAGMPRVVP